MSNAVLVTGGAGYIGSHTSLHLLDAGHRVVVLDNLYSGHRWAVPEDALFVEGNAGDVGLVRELLDKHKIGAIVHFAAHVVVPESVSDPLKYYGNNVSVTFGLLSAANQIGLSRLIFSSSAAVYGSPQRIPVPEDEPTLPINPYGRSKLISEWMLEDLALARSETEDPFRYVALRYFNVAGARPDGSLGQATPDATHLIKVACEAACRTRDQMKMYGDDYDTPDGTCIRDYIHVEDLAAAHVAALAYLESDGRSRSLNCGYGHGYSVQEVVETVKRVSGVDFEATMAPRRPGDPPVLVADSRKIREAFAWKPQYDDLPTICEHAFQWEQKLGQRRLAG